MGWGLLAKVPLVEPRPMKHCKTCEVAWNDSARCFVCGKRGDVGGIPFSNGLGQTPPHRTWYGSDPAPFVMEDDQ